VSLPRPRLAALGAASLLAAFAAPAAGRSLERTRLRVDVASGAVKTVWSARGADANRSWPRPRWPAGVQRARAFQSIDRSGGIVRSESGVVVARDPARSLVARVELPAVDRAVRWGVVLDRVVVFARPLPGGASRWFGADLASGRVMWKRDRRAHSRPGVTAVGRSRLVVSTARGVELVDAGTGATVRTLAPASADFGALEAGDVIVETDAAVHALDPATGARRWSASKRGRAVAYLALAKHRALLRTDQDISLLDTRTGKLLWRVAAPGRDPLFVAGPRVVIPAVTRTPEGHGVAKLHLWRLRDGAPLATRDVARHRRFFDTARVDVLGARGRDFELDLSWIVLD
jgi:hypothetical protein